MFGIVNGMWGNIDAGIIGNGKLLLEHNKYDHFQFSLLFSS